MSAAGETAVPERRETGAFTWAAPVYFDDLDAMAMLHNARYFVLADRAISAFFEAQGRRWERDVRRNPDQHWAVRQQAMEYARPYRGVGQILVDLTVEHLGSSSATYAFRFRSGNGTEHARGSRTVVKIDPGTLRPAPWTERTRAELATLVTDR